MKFNGKDITELLALNRRNFLKLIVGGAVGTGLSPLPWKLTDDSAIWTQNWPWLPVPPDGEFTHVKSVCTLCPGGCGIEVRKVDERAVKIEGRTDYPVNPGGICPVGMGGLQLQYNERGRFTGPMKRIGPRGSGKFQQISWDEALDTLVERISLLRKNGNINSLAAVDGNFMGTTMSVMVERLLNALGSPNYFRVPTSLDTGLMANDLMQGKKVPPTYDLENSDYILSFGCGLLEGWGAPGRILGAWGLWKSLMREKIRIVQVESRASNTASKADQWIPARPGTETALALGIAHVIVREGIYDAEFVENNTFGFSDWTDSDGRVRMGFKSMIMDKYSPFTVEKITGVKEKDINSLARAFAGAKAPVAICGKGRGAVSGSLYEFMAIQALNALAGNINRPGGVLMHDPLPLTPLPDIETDYIAVSGLNRPPAGREENREYPFTQSLLNSFSEAVIKDSGTAVDTILIFSSNPAYTLPDGGNFRRALEKVPFIVSFSPYHEESSDMADLVLPDHTYLEKMEDIVWPSGLQYPLYGLTRPILEPIYDTRNSGDTIIQLAEKIGGTVKDSFPWKDYETVLKVRAEGLFNSEGGFTAYDGTVPPWKQLAGSGYIRPDYQTFEKMWEKIKSGGLWYRPAHGYEKRNYSFDTPTGKFEFFSRKIEDMALKKGVETLGIHASGDEAFMPHYEPAHTENEEKEFPLQMVPYELINISDGRLPAPPYLNKTLFDNQLLKKDSFVEINPGTARRLNLKEGDMAFIVSRNGKAGVRIHLFEGAMPGIVYMPSGLGRRYNDGFADGKGINPNEIIDAGRDPLSGHPAWWNTRVKLIKA